MEYFHLPRRHGVHGGGREKLIIETSNGHKYTRIIFIVRVDFFLNAEIQRMQRFVVAQRIQTFAEENKFENLVVSGNQNVLIIKYGDPGIISGGLMLIGSHVGCSSGYGFTFNILRITEGVACTDGRAIRL